MSGIVSLTPVVTLARTTITGIAPSRAPKTVGPYVHATVHENTVYSTCILPIDPKSGQLVGDTAEERFRRIYQNLSVVLEEAGSSPQRILKQTLYLTDLADFYAFNKLTVEFLGDHRPARATVKVLGLPLEAPCGLEVIAARN